MKKWVEFNAKYSALWPNIFEQKDPLPDAKDWDGVPNKMDHFSDKSGNGS